MTTSPTAQACPRHPDEQATKTCARCASPACYLCARAVGGEDVCLRCRTSGATAGGSKLGLYATLAVLAAGSWGLYLWQTRADEQVAAQPVATPEVVGPDEPSQAAVDTGTTTSKPPQPPLAAASTTPQRMAYANHGVAFTVPPGCQVLTRLEGPSLSVRVLKEGKDLIEVCVLTLFPWIRTAETLNYNGPYVESKRALLPGQREVPFGGERWSFREAPNPQLFLFGAERMVFIRSLGRQTPWEVGGPELEVAGSFEWLELPPLRERARQRHGISAEQAAGSADPKLMAEIKELAIQLRKLGALPPSVLGAVQWSERDDLVHADALLLRDFMLDVIHYVEQSAMDHPR